MKCFTNIVCSALVCLFCQQTYVLATFLKIQNNRYDDFIIAISPTIKEDHNIITKLKEIVSEASHYLYTATRKRAYFGNVKILVPHTWTRNSSWGAATVETFDDADIRIDQPSPQYGPNPYTYQPEGCGDPGRYIHLTDDYVLDRDGTGEMNWGPPGRVLVHEFSHLRYGVFDEYGLGTEEYPFFYIDDHQVYPTGCTSLIRGRLAGDCTIDSSTNLPGNDCVFLTDREHNTAKASIMYDSSVKSVTDFCESNSNDPDLLHNTLAPNQQNKMCNQRGTWDVIKEHADFNGANPPVNKSEAEMVPNFSILYRETQTTTAGAEICGRPVVLVLDVSGSMIGNRQFRQTQTADKLIRDILPVGTKVGIVSFSAQATTLMPLTSLSSQSDRDNVARHLPTQYGGGTGIGLGLQLAKTMLVQAGEAKEGRIVLITDGEENVEPSVQAVKNEIVSTGIRVHSVAYSMAAAKAIRKLSVDSGGQYAYYSEDPRSTVLDSIIETLMKDISICNHRVRIEIMRTAKALAPYSPVIGQINIDRTLGDDTMFVFTLPEGNSVTVSLQSPDGHNYDSRSAEYSLDSTLNIVRFIFPKAQPGTWLYTLTSSQSGTVSVVVKALPGDHSDPYEITSWLSSTDANLNVHKPTIVYVRVHKGYSPVLDADVAVTVERPLGAPVTLNPLDDGKLPDNLADDGVYSAYFTQYNGNQRYSLDVEVRGIPGKTRYLVQGNITLSGALSRFRNTSSPVQTVAVAENFTRTTSPGAMDVKGFEQGKDKFPPVRVTDLTVEKFSNETRTVTLIWTAPGDDLDQGTASKYDLRMAKTANQLSKSWSTCPIVTPSMIKSGSLYPQLAGEQERIVVFAPEDWTTMVFGLKAIDDAGHQSDLSKLVAVTFKETELVDPISESKPTSIRDNSKVFPTAAVIGGVLGGCVAVFLVIVSCVVYHVKIKNKVSKIPNKSKTLNRTQATAPSRTNEAFVSPGSNPV